MERTLSIIKPDAVKKNLIGKIVARFEEEGLPSPRWKVHLSKREAEGFYAVHAERPFFGERQTSCRPVPLWSSCSRATTPSPATVRSWAPPTPLRPLRAPSASSTRTSIGENAVHGSDAPETAAVEISYFFRGTELS